MTGLLAMLCVCIYQPFPPLRKSLGPLTGEVFEQPFLAHAIAVADARGAKFL